MYGIWFYKIYTIPSPNFAQLFRTKDSQCITKKKLKRKKRNRQNKCSIINCLQISSVRLDQWLRQTLQSWCLQPTRETCILHTTLMLYRKDINISDLLCLLYWPKWQNLQRSDAENYYFLPHLASRLWKEKRILRTQDCKASSNRQSCPQMKLIKGNLQQLTSPPLTSHNINLLPKSVTLTFVRWKSAAVKSTTETVTQWLPQA